MSEAKHEISKVLAMTASGSGVTADMLCTICTRKKRSVIIVLCHHFVMCNDCAERSIGSNTNDAYCPICNERVQDVKKVLM